MTFPNEATVKKWALRGAAFLFASAIVLFIAFGVLSYREEVEAFDFGYPHDSITSAYLGLLIVAIYAAFGAVVATGIYFGATFVARFRSHGNNRNG